jgi:hypothetical protein
LQEETATIRVAAGLAGKTLDGVFAKLVEGHSSVSPANEENFYNLGWDRQGHKRTTAE